MGSSVHPSFTSPADTILSPQLLLQFSRDFNEISSYCSHDLKMIMFYRSHARIDLNRFCMVGCFGFYGPLRQYFSLYRAISQREGEMKERKDRGE